MLTKNLAGHFFLLFCLVAFSAVANAQLRQPQSSVLQRARCSEPYLQEAAAKYGVEARLLWVIAYLETRFNPLAVSHKGARGLMQFMPATAARWGLQNPHDPVAAIDAAARYVLYLQTSFGRKPELILAAYNAGETAVTAYLTGQAIRVGNQVINPANRITGGIPPYRETQDYVATGLQLLGHRLSSAQITPAFLSLPVKPSATRRKPKAIISLSSQQPAKNMSFTDIQGEKTGTSASVRQLPYVVPSAFRKHRNSTMPGQNTRVELRFLVTSKASTAFLSRPNLAWRGSSSLQSFLLMPFFFQFCYANFTAHQKTGTSHCAIAAVCERLANNSCVTDRARADYVRNGLLRGKWRMLLFYLAASASTRSR
jgi:hypothetical protein